MSSRARKRPRKAKAAAAPPPPPEALVAAIPRAGLEELVLRAHRGEAPSREDLEAAVERGRARPKAVVALADERRGTGAFDVVDGECLGRVLEHLPIAARLAMATVVCKSWLRLRAAKGLWTSVCANDPPSILREGFFTNEHVGYESWAPTDHVLVDRRNVRTGISLRTVSFLNWTEWVLDKDAVIELCINTGDDAIASDAVNFALDAFPRLQTLVLDGKKILTQVWKHRPAVLGQLRTLVVGNGVPSGGKGQMCKFLEHCVKLETLCVKSEMVPFSGLEAVAAAWRAARGGAAPLLTNLRLLGWHGGLQMNDFAVAAAIGGWFPNLETFAFSAYNSVHGYGVPWSAGIPTLSTFPNLKHLRIGGERWTYYNCSDEELADLLRVVLAATPKIERLSLHAGYSKRHPRAPPVVPTGLTLPASLTQLDLTEIGLFSHSIAAGHSLKLLQVRCPDVDVVELLPDSESDDSPTNLTDNMIDELKMGDALKDVVVQRYGGTPADWGKDEGAKYGYSG